MNWSFCICTDGNSDNRINFTIDSILYQNIPKFEILICGGWTSDIAGRPHTRHIPFDETQCNGWITRKKSILAQEAKFDNVVLLHDYFKFLPGWYEGWCSFGNDFEVANNVILNMEGTRHSDWAVHPYDFWRSFPDRYEKDWNVSLLYDTVGLSKIQYISGGYFVVKKDFMLRHPFDESLTWGQKEDLVWSEEVRQITDFKFNPYSTVQIMKSGKWAPGLINLEDLEKVKGDNGL